MVPVKVQPENSLYDYYLQSALLNKSRAFFIGSGKWTKQKHQGKNSYIKNGRLNEK